MSVSDTMIPEIYTFGVPAQKGGPQGVFGLQKTKIGESGGGTSAISIDMPLEWLQGKQLLIRRMVVYTDGTTVRATSVSVVGGYMGVAASEVSAGPTVVGAASTTRDILGAMPLWYKCSNNETDNTFLQSVMPNTDGEAHGIYLFGEFWDEAQLRVGGTGPLIMW